MGTNVNTAEDELNVKSRPLKLIPNVILSVVAVSNAPHFFISNSPAIDGTHSRISMKLFGSSG